MGPLGPRWGVTRPGVLPKAADHPLTRLWAPRMVEEGEKGEGGWGKS